MRRIFYSALAFASSLGLASCQSTDDRDLSDESALSQPEEEEEEATVTPAAEPIAEPVVAVESDMSEAADSRGHDSSTADAVDSAGSTAESMTAIDIDSLDSNRVMMVQNALNDQGADIAVDGVVGPQTRQALQDFKNSKDLGTDETLDDATFAALGLDASSMRVAH